VLHENQVMPEIHSVDTHKYIRTYQAIHEPVVHEEDYLESLIDMGEEELLAKKIS
jgi:hypothetical protein